MQRHILAQDCQVMRTSIAEPSSSFSLLVPTVDLQANGWGFSNLVQSLSSSEASAYSPPVGYTSNIQIFIPLFLRTAKQEISHFEVQFST